MLTPRPLSTAPRTLLDLVKMIRIEAGRSANPAMGVNDLETVKYIANRTQQELYYNFDWPGLMIDRDVRLADGQRYYDYPTDLQFEDVNTMWVMVNTVYNEVGYGIGPDQWRIWNSDQGYKSWPTVRWMHNTDSNKFELWPIPDGNAASQASYVRLRGTKTLADMTNDADTVTLNGYLLGLYAAAELLARDGSKDASLKLGKAEKMRLRMGVRQTTHKRKPFVIGGGFDQTNGAGRIGMEFIPVGYGAGPSSA